MKVTNGKLPGIVLCEPQVFEDSRGHFLETYQEQRYSECGIPWTFVQDNMSFSRKDVLRGLHYQTGRFPQGKLIWVLQGRIWDVAVDIRRGSPTFGMHTGLILSSDNYLQIYIPEGFAHGFCVLSESALVMYKVTKPRAAEAERGIRWDDPRLGIAWPIGDPVLSEKDARLPLLSSVAPGDLPVYDPERTGAA